MLDGCNFVGAENWDNLFAVRYSADAPTEEERGRLESAGEFHLGEPINRFLRGSLSKEVAHILTVYKRNSPFQALNQ